MSRPRHDLIDNSMEITIDNHKFRLGTLTAGDALVLVKHTHGDATAYTIVKKDATRLKDIYRDIAFNKQV